MTVFKDQAASPLLIPHTIGATVQAVLDRIFTKIKSGEYPQDTRLPSERALASEIGVARNTVREALDVLEAQGVIKRRPGSGNFVTYRSAKPRDQGEDAVALQTSPLDHLVARGILEPEIVRLAVLNMTPQDLNDLERLMSQIETVQTDVEAFVRSEEAFYRKIAQGTRNPLLASCYELTIKACRASFRTALLRRHLSPKRILDYQKRYNSLFNAIAARDVERAVEYIKLHLVEEQKLLLQDG
ncbi:MAG: FadR/GntR family transcriptional regulator [Qingshengfaniella sp.]